MDRTGSQTKQKQPPDGAAQKLHMEVSIASNNFCHRYISFNMVNDNFYPQLDIITITFLYRYHTLITTYGNIYTCFVFLKVIMLYDL